MPNVLSLSLLLFPFLFLAPSLSICLSLARSLCISLSLARSVSRSLSLPLFFYSTFSLSLPLYLSISLPLYLYLYLNSLTLCGGTDLKPTAYTHKYIHTRDMHTSTWKYIHACSHLSSMSCMYSGHLLLQTACEAKPAQRSIALVLCIYP